MAFQISSGLRGANPTLQIFDSTSGSVRLAWEYPRHDPELSETDRELLQMKREEAIHQLFCKLFLLTTEQYLKGKITDSSEVSAPNAPDDA